MFNVLSGHGVPAGEVLAKHMDVRVLSFTGSSRTGKLLQENAAKTNLKKVVLELGGKSPAIVFEDANLAKAVEQTQASIQSNSGQVCMANSRIYVQKSVAEAFVEAFNKRFAQVNAGDPTQPGVDHGPQADEVQYKNVTSYIEEGKTVGTLLARRQGEPGEHQRLLRRADRLPEYTRGCEGDEGGDLRARRHDQYLRDRRRSDPESQ